MPLVLKLLVFVALCVAVFGALGFVFLGKSRTLALGLNAAVFGIATLVALLIAEFGVRLAFRDITSTPDNSSYFALRWKERSPHVENSLGFRDDEIGRKEEGVFRIGVVGDSFTYGQGVPEEARFTEHLEEGLKAHGRYEVLNFGRPGAETIHHVQILRDIAPVIEPDYVLLQWFVNDVENGDYGDRPEYLPLVPSAALRDVLHRHSALYYIAMYTWQTFQASWGPGFRPSYVDYMMGRFADSTSTDSRRAAQAVEDFFDVCDDLQVPCGMVLFPQMSESLGSELGFLLDRVLAQCVARSIPCLDLRDALSSAEEPESLWANRFDSHPGPAAHAIAAEAIAERFAPLWELDRTL